MDVSIDNDFARINGKSYAINKINSVEVRTTQPHTVGGAVVLGAIALVSALFWFGAALAPDGSATMPFVITLIFAALAYRQWQRSKLRDHHLFLMTSSSEAEALTSRDEHRIISLREQIEAAMLHHSRGGRES